MTDQPPAYKALLAVVMIPTGAAVIAVAWWSITTWGWLAWQTFAVAILIEPLIVAIGGGIHGLLCAAFGIKMPDD